MPEVPYTKGVHQVADGVWAYLQPDGGWGWSNAGLIESHGGETSLLVDTLFDLELTREMLAALRHATPAAEHVDTVVNTHANGDHCYGNALLPEADIVASSASAEEMADLPPAAMAGFLRAAPNLGDAGAFLADIFAPFHFDGIEPLPPTRTFTGEADIEVGDRTVRLIDVGPAHTAGDTIAHVPDAGVVFTGDIVFNGGHPIVWAGPVASWIAACDRILSLPGVETVVPGHGPVGGPEIVTVMKSYFEFLTTEARTRFDAGMTPLDASLDIELGAFETLNERERLAANVNALYRDFGAAVPSDAATVMDLMAQYRKSFGSATP